MDMRFLQLGDDPELRAPHLRPLLDLLRRQSRIILDSFGVFLGLSILCHIAIFGFIAAQGGPSVPSGTDVLRSNINAFAQALMEREREFVDVPSGTDPSVRNSLADQVETISSLLRFDRTISDRGKMDFFRSLIEAAEVVPDESADLPFASDPSSSLIKVLEDREKLGSPSGNAFFITRNPVDDTFEVDSLDQGAMEKIEQMNGADGSSANAVGRYGPSSVPTEYLLKKSPYAAISARGPRLFTVFRGFPEIAEEGPTTSPAPETDEMPYRAARQDSSASFVFLVPRPATMVDASGKTVLHLSPEERARVLDDLMALKEPEQLKAFKVRYLDVYDPDLGDLAVLTREFFYSNLNGIFVLTNLVASTFDKIEGIYFRRAVYDSFAAYGRRLYDTRTGVVLYLNLASAYDFERRALSALYENRAYVQRALAENEGHFEANQLRLKAFVLDKLYREVVDLNGTVGVSFGDLSALYLRRQEEIYRHVSELGGEARNRALWLWGRLRWELGDIDSAVALWKRADTSYPLPSRAFRTIREKIDRYDSTKITVSAGFSHDVNEWLMAENAQDRQVLLERHLKYKTWAKRAERP
jgi:hypothetical protein